MDRVLDLTVSQPPSSGSIVAFESLLEVFEDIFKSSTDLGVLSPLVREMFIWMIQETVYRGGGKGARNKYSIRLSSSYYMETRHAIFLAIILGSIATPITCYCVIGIKIAYSCFQYSQPF